MKTINVENVPEQVAQALAIVAEHFQRAVPVEEPVEEPADKPSTRERVKLRTWPGNVIGKLTREEIYEDV